jgi:membrane-bound metal-dependent hydrolase YbcI (DUF457 family)
LWIDLFIILFLAGASHLILDLITPPGAWKGIPVFFPSKDGGQFARIGGWSNIGWYDYRITWILFNSVIISMIVFRTAIYLKNNVFIKKTLHIGILIIFIVSYTLIANTIVKSSYTNSKEWNEFQRRYMDTLPQYFKEIAAFSRYSMNKIIK